MNNPFIPQIGGVLSADIAVPEHDRELRFYSRVLSTGERPLWRENDLMNNLGIPIIGLGEQSGEYADLPVQWMPHIQVADVTTSVQNALDLGGNVLMHNKDDPGESQWAVLLDLNDAAFGVVPVPPEEAIPSGDGNLSDQADSSVGHIVWLDLTVADAAQTRDFYRQVIGWSVENIEIEDGGETYTDFSMVGGDGKPAAGVCHAPGANKGLPPVWLIYLPVGDLDESLRRVQEEGGKVIKKMKGEDGKLAFATIQDPVGAHVALLPG